MEYESYELIRVFGLFSSFAVLIYILIDSKKRGMSQAWAIFSIIGLIGLLIYVIARNNRAKSVVSNQTINIPQVQSEKMAVKFDIPETCPICKNPNAKKIRICEWCGNQII